MPYCPLITQTLRIISVRSIPLSLRSMTRWRATLLLPSWIYSCQSVGTSTSHFPFMTSVTIFLISILQTFRSWVATSHLRPPMAFLFHISGFAPLMNVFFFLRAVRLSNKLLAQGYGKDRYRPSLRKFYCQYGDLIKQYEVPLSRLLHDTLDDDHIQWHPPLIRHKHQFLILLLIWTLLLNLTFYLIARGFHRTYATGMACP